MAVSTRLRIVVSSFIYFSASCGSTCIVTSTEGRMFKTVPQVFGMSSKWTDWVFLVFLRRTVLPILTVGFPNPKIRGGGSRTDRGQLPYCGNFLRLIALDCFFVARRLRRGSCARARHLDLERAATRFTNNVPTGAGGEPFYDALKGHKDDNRKLNEVDRTRRCGFHYRGRIYFTTTQVPRPILKPALF